MLARFSAGMPMPESLTLNRSSAPSPSVAPAGSTFNRTWPRSVNLIALESRFKRTCRNRPGSPRSTLGTEAEISCSSSNPFCSARKRMIRARSRVTSSGENSIRSKVSLPASILDKSSTSLITSSSDSAVVFTSSRLSRSSCCTCTLSKTSSVMPIIPLIGVRISWLICARKLLLASLAATARSSARLRSITSTRSSSA